MRLPVRALNAAADFLFPERCVLCGNFILPKTRAGPYPLCLHCVSALSYPEPPRCRLCSRPLISEKGVCMSCRRISLKEPDKGANQAAPGQAEKRGGGAPAAGPAGSYNETAIFPFEENVSVFVYQDPGIAELVVSWKGRKNRSLAAFFAEKLLAEYNSRWKGLPIVPVPSRPASLKKRGFDPILLLCREMQKRGGPPALRLISRKGKTREQKSLNRDERQRNLLGALVPRRKLCATLPRAVVLLDDVFTTGATAAACTEVLKGMGIEKVYVLTIALD